jgi:hypothetical protein
MLCKDERLKNEITELTSKEVPGNEVIRGLSKGAESPLGLSETA